MTGSYNPPWAGRRRQEALRLVKAKGRMFGLPCSICQQPIDYSLEYPDPWSCSVQHVKSQRDYPHLRWDAANHAPAHLDCNKSEGADRDSSGSLGVTSREW